MSTDLTAGTPAPAPEAAPAPAKEIARPLLWLLAVLAVGLVLRVLPLRDKPFQNDEFTALAAAAERQGVPVGVTPTAEDPLVPLPSLADVRKLSVIPFGIIDPVPLYHGVLWGVGQVLPVAAWSMRLPSLLAGVACIAVVFFLLRRPFGNEMALVAALFVAVDPVQIATSWLAQPYALANLFVVLSFAAVWALVRGPGPVTAALLALGYGLCVAVIGYLNGLLLLVVTAHAGMALYALRAGGTGRWAAAYWAGGLALALVLLIPEYGYFYQVASFAVGHNAYLTAANDTTTHDIHLWKPFTALFWHNLMFLGGLVLVLLAAAVVRMQLQGGGEEARPEGEAAEPTNVPADAPPGDTTTAVTAAPQAAVAAPAAAPATAPDAPAAPLPENEGALWMARLWLFLPQLALLVASLFVSTVVRTPFITYTTLAAAIVLAYYATRDGSREVRLGVSLVVAVGLLVMGYFPDYSGGQRLFSGGLAQRIMGLPHSEDLRGGLAGMDMDERWKPGDVVLLRSGLIESDLLRTDIPEAARPAVERAMLAPLTLLYDDSSHKPVIPLTLSQYRNDKIRTPAGDKAPLTDYYDAEFVARLKNYDRFWLTGVGPGDTPNSWYYLAGFVPWLVDHLDRGELVIARNRPDRAERYVVVKPHLGLEESIKGLTEDIRPTDYNVELHVVRKPDLKK
jgi:hypothetical protein